MKTTAILFTLIFGMIMTNANDPFDYTKAWKEVQKFIDDGLPESATTKVDEIYKAAIKEGNNEQLVKAVNYMGRLSLNMGEDGVEKVMNLYEVQIEKIKSPYRNILESQYADFLFNYFNNNRYAISQRTALMDNDASFRTLTTEGYLTKIGLFYFQSLEGIGLEKSITDFPELITEYDKKGQALRPSLYDVLVEKTLNFYSSGNGTAVETVDRFKINSKDFFLPAQDFVNLKLDQKDTSSLQYKTVKLYKDILKKKMKSDDTESLANFDLMRMEYVYNNSNLESKSKTFTSALYLMKETYAKAEYSSIIAAVLARQVMNDQEDANNLVKAKEICERAIALHPKSNGAGQCQQILDEILSKNITIKVGETVLPNEEINVQITSKNLANVYLKLVKMNADQWRDLENMDVSVKTSFLKSLPVVAEVSEKTSMLGDFHEVTDLYKLKSVDLGLYALIASNTSEYSESYSFALFQATKLAYSSLNIKKVNQIIVVDRKTGAAICDANVMLFEHKYDYNQRKQIRTQIYNGLTNKDGILNYAGDVRNFTVEVSKDKDIYLSNQNHNNYYYDQNNQEYKSIEVFTDRAIYRPGQVVYFKIIALNYDQERVPSILQKEKATVILNDANGQQVASLDLLTNEFGSASGSFTLPIGQLTGYFAINTPYGGKSILVEEYKRPTFEIKMDTSNQEYSIGEELSAVGAATAYAGNGISNAKVSYTVERYVSFPYYRRYIYPPYQVSRIVLVSDETETDVNGKFEIKFIALGEEDDKKDAIYHYDVKVNIVDQSGESHSAIKTYTISKVKLQLSTDLTAECDVKNWKPIHIYAKNLEGSLLEKMGEYKIEKLIEPKTIESYSKFDEIPQPYFKQQAASKSPYELWKVEKLAVKGKFDSGAEIIFQPKAGVYKLTATLNQGDGQIAELVEYFVVYDNNKGIFPMTKQLFTTFNQSTYRAGDKMVVTFGSPSKTVHTYATLSRGDEVIQKTWKKVNNKSELEYTVGDADKGGLQLNIFYVMENNAFSESFPIDVPWIEKDLDIEFVTFRDKLLPGQDEEWTIKIKGNEKDKAMAEMLLSMYDASLDQFVNHSWSKSFFPTRYSNLRFEYDGFGIAYGQELNYNWNMNENHATFDYPHMPQLITFETYYYSIGRDDVMMSDMKVMKSGAPAPRSRNQKMEEPSAMEADAVSLESNQNGGTMDETSSTELEKVQESMSPRANLKETVFFMPNLYTDAEGNVVVKFKMNEAMTKWKVLGFAHTKDFKYGFLEKSVVTQKDLMIIANSPRFVRQGDELWFTAKVSNLSDHEIQASASLDLVDDATLQSKELLIATDKKLNVQLKKGETKAVAWKIAVGNETPALLKYTVSAKSGTHIDGEEGFLPILTNRTMVTETLPMVVRGGQTKDFVFENLKSNTSSSLMNYQYVIESSTSPVWYAVQALPYIIGQNDECVTQLTDRYYANSVASNIVEKNPSIESIFKLWKTQGSDALKSNLEKNQDLKNALLKETPWVMDAINEAQQKENIARLFDRNTVQADLNQTWNKLITYQSSNGGFFWFPGMKENRWVTLYFLETIGTLDKSKVTMNNDRTDVIQKAVNYLDGEMSNQFVKLKEDASKYGWKLEDYKPDNNDVYALYVRSFFEDVVKSGESKKAYDFYENQMAKIWNSYPLYPQSMVGLILFRHNNSLYKNILKSFKEKAVKSELKGAYWNEGNGYNWYEMPIERQVMMMNFFNEADVDEAFLDEMKLWLLTNKQTNNWKTSKATASAVHGLLMNKGNREISLKSANPVVVKLSGKEVPFSDREAGTLYSRSSFAGKEINPSFANISITNPNQNVSWSAAYWQYFEDINKVKVSADTPLNIKKETYKEMNTSSGIKLIKIDEKTTLHPGDVLVSRLTVSTDRNMEYIHIKDMRASGLEPNEALSGYRWQTGFGYYESIRDLASHFYISYLPKGVHVFESRQKVVHRGRFSGGMTTISSYYAPEFSGHSAGEDILVE